MDTLTLIVSESKTAVTFTSDEPLAIPPFIESADVDAPLTWTNLYQLGVLDGNPMTPSSHAVFGLHADADFIEMFAHITRIDATLNLWEVRKTESSPLVAYAQLDECYSIIDFWYTVPEDLTIDDIERW